MYILHYILLHRRRGTLYDIGNPNDDGRLVALRLDCHLILHSKSCGFPYHHSHWELHSVSWHQSHERDGKCGRGGWGVGGACCRAAATHHVASRREETFSIRLSSMTSEQGLLRAGLRWGFSADIRIWHKIAWLSVEIFYWSLDQLGLRTTDLEHCYWKGLLTDNSNIYFILVEGGILFFPQPAMFCPFFKADVSRPINHPTSTVIIFWQGCQRTALEQLVSSWPVSAACFGINFWKGRVGKQQNYTGKALSELES